MVIPLVLTAGVLLSFLVVMIGISRAPVWVKVLVLAGVLLRIFVSEYRLRVGGLDFDALAYHLEATRLKESLETGTEYSAASVFDGKSGWTTLLGYLYYLGGAEPILGFVFNSIVVAAISLVVFATSRQIGATVEGASFAAICVLAPQFFVWGTLLLREPVIWLAIAVVAHLGVKLFVDKNSNFATLAGLAVAMAVLFSFRASIAAVLLSALLIFAVAGSKITQGLRTAAILGMVIAVPFISNYVEESRLLDAERLVMSRTELASSSSGFGPSADLTAATIYLNTPINFIRVLLGPFPWEIAALGPVAVFEWVCWVVFTAPIIYVVWKRSGKGALPVVLAIFIMVSISVSSGNYGGISRLRLMSLVSALPLLAVWWDLNVRREVEKTTEFNSHRDHR